MVRTTTLLLLLLASLSACREVVVRVETIPSNTPENASVYVSGDFNHWNPADGGTRLRKGPDGAYYTTLPAGMGRTSYTFTRGDWTTTERDACGHELKTRVVDYFSAEDTLHLRIDSWKDLGPTHCNRVVMRIKHVPSETPAQDSIYLASNYNYWRADHPNYRFRKAPNGSYLLDIEPQAEDLVYKITRGSWSKEVVDANGNTLGNSQVQLGLQDTVDVDIHGWRDIDAGLLPGSRTFEVRVPSNTPPQENIYIAGNFNSWKPNDPKFKLTPQGPHLYCIKLKKGKGIMYYKFTRGSWDQEEYDFYGNAIGNRRLRSGPGPVKILVDAWRDISPRDYTDSVLSPPPPALSASTAQEAKPADAKGEAAEALMLQQAKVAKEKQQEAMLKQAAEKNAAPNAKRLSPADKNQDFSVPNRASIPILINLNNKKKELEAALRAPNLPKYAKANLRFHLKEINQQISEAEKQREEGN